MTYVPWILSAWTLVTMWLAGNGTKWAWVSGLASQALWLVFDWHVEAWGLMPLAVLLSAVYIRNWRKAVRIVDTPFDDVTLGPMRAMSHE